MIRKYSAPRHLTAGCTRSAPAVRESACTLPSSVGSAFRSHVSHEGWWLLVGTHRPDSVSVHWSPECRLGYIIIRLDPAVRPCAVLPMGQQQLPLLPFHELAARHHGLIESIAEAYTAAACVCLDRHHHPPANIAIRSENSLTRARLDWQPADERTRGALNNQIDTTEGGAYACVIAALELCERLYAVRRAETGTGADYYVAPAGKGLDDLEDCFRLEISGTDRGNLAAVQRLLHRKVSQAKAGNSNLPALAGVIGFEVLSVLIEYVNHT
jgi:hypothetical protein